MTGLFLRDAGAILVNEVMLKLPLLLPPLPLLLLLGLALEGTLVMTLAFGILACMPVPIGPTVCGADGLPETLEGLGDPAVCTVFWSLLLF